MIDENEIVNFKFDLLDLGIAICTQAVPPLFADNFDCQTLDEFIIGVLQDDLTDNTLHMHELSNDGYAARITDYHTYFGVRQHTKFYFQYSNFSFPFSNLCLCAMIFRQGGLQ